MSGFLLRSMGPNAPVVTLVVGGVVLALTVWAVLSSSALTRLALSPAAALLGSRRPWTLVTGSLVEGSFAKLVLSLGSIAYLGRIAEAKMGLAPFGVFVGITTVLTGLSIALASVLLYFVTSAMGLLFDDIYGSFGVVTAMAMAVTQLDPEAHVPGVPNLRHRLLPFYVLVATPVFEFVLGIGEDTALTCVSFLLSWAYLRFWQPHGTSRGDFREDFCFVSLFPEFMRPPMEAVVRIGTPIFSKVSFLRPPSEAPAPLATGIHHAPDVEAPVIADPVAERRRARALKALNSRMAQIGKPRGAAALGVRSSTASSDAATAVTAAAAATTVAPVPAPAAAATATAPAPAHAPTAPAP